MTIYDNIWHVIVRGDTIANLVLNSWLSPGPRSPLWSVRLSQRGSGVLADPRDQSLERSGRASDCAVGIFICTVKSRPVRNYVRKEVKNEVKSIQMGSIGADMILDGRKLQVSSPRFAKVLGLRCPWNKLRCMGSRRSPELHKVQSSQNSQTVNSSVNTPTYIIIYQRVMKWRTESESLCTESDASGCLAGSSSVPTQEPDQTQDSDGSEKTRCFLDLTSGKSLSSLLDVYHWSHNWNILKSRQHWRSSRFEMIWDNQGSHNLRFLPKSRVAQRHWARRCCGSKPPRATQRYPKNLKKQVARLG